MPFDRAFIDAMIPHHEAAIEMARDAKTRGLSQRELIDVAGDIIATQRAEISQLTEWREAWYGGAPESPQRALAVLGLSEEEAGMAEHGDLSLEEDVDRAFATMMIEHHEGAIEMAELAEDRAGHQEIRTLAQAIIAAQSAEIEKLRPHAEEHH